MTNLGDSRAAEVARIGVVVPSSNTVMEPALARIRAGLDHDILFLHARVRVTVVDDDADPTGQFALAPMATAAGLLADAAPSGIVWGGTSGGWLGLEADRAIAGALECAAGVPATTSTLAIVDQLRDEGVDRVGIVTPYVPPVCRRIEEVYRGVGFGSVTCLGAGLTESRDFSSLDAVTLERQAAQLVSAGAEAIVVSCTNVDGRAAVARARSAGVIGIDSNAATYRAAARFARIAIAPSDASSWL